MAIAGRHTCYLPLSQSDKVLKKWLLKSEPIHLARFVVDLRVRHLDFGAPYSDTHPRERDSKLH